MVNEERSTGKKTPAKKTAAPKPKRAAASREAKAVKTVKDESRPRRNAGDSGPSKRHEPARKGAARSRETVGVTAEQRRAMIAEAAYLKAERRGFAGDPGQYWREAEVEIDALLMG